MQRLDSTFARTSVWGPKQISVLPKKNKWNSVALKDSKIENRAFREFSTNEESLELHFFVIRSQNRRRKTKGCWAWPMWKLSATFETRTNLFKRIYSERQEVVRSLCFVRYFERKKLESGVEVPTLRLFFDAHAVGDGWIDVLVMIDIFRPLVTAFNG